MRLAFEPVAIAVVEQEARDRGLPIDLSSVSDPPRFEAAIGLTVTIQRLQLRAIHRLS